MKLGGHRWRVRIATVTFDGKPFRVVRPAGPILDASLHETTSGGTLSVHKSFAPDLAAAWWLAARSPRTIVHLPLRTSGHADDWSTERPLDLVLLHHSLGLRPSAWKSLRRRASSGDLHTVTLPERPFREIDTSEYDASLHRDFRDHLRPAVAAGTLFIVGSRRAFELQAHTFRDLAVDGPAYLHKNPDHHCCEEIWIGDSARGHVLYVHYCDVHRRRPSATETAS